MVVSATERPPLCEQQRRYPFLAGQPGRPDAAAVTAAIATVCDPGRHRRTRAFAAFLEPRLSVQTSSVSAILMA